MLLKYISNKALVVTGLAASALLVGIGMTQANHVGTISLEKAKAIALADAQVSADKVYFITAENDRDDNRHVYDIEFYDGQKEYDYEISVTDGRIVKRDFEVEYFNPVRTDPSASQPSTSQPSTPSTPPSSTAPSQAQTGISDSKAKDIALSAAGLTENAVAHLKIESETENGALVYDVEFYDPATGREYDYTIERQTGRIIEVDHDMESYAAPAVTPTQPAAPTPPAAGSPAPASPAPASPTPAPAPPVRANRDWDDDDDDWDDDDWDDRHDDDDDDD